MTLLNVLSDDALFFYIEQGYGSYDCQRLGWHHNSPPTVMLFNSMTNDPLQTLQCQQNLLQQHYFPSVIFFFWGLGEEMCGLSCSEVNYPVAANKSLAFPGDFTSNCVTSGFAAIVGCHISALTLTSLCICERTWGFLNFCVGTAWFISPFPYYFRVIWSDMARVVVMFNKKSINQKRKTYKAITVFWNQTESKVLTSTEDKMLDSTSKYSK